MIQYTIQETLLGPLLFVAAQDALTGLYFCGRKHAPAINAEWREAPELPLFHQVQAQLEEFATGQRTTFNVPILLSGTPFQMEVWREIHQIPFGQTITYAELARRVGRPAAIRAVGTATGRNPISWIVPCHRVIGSNGAITGYAGGLERKRLLLDLEMGCPALLQTALE